MISGKTLMITGATGSFGRTVMKRMLNENLDEIRVFSRDEKKQEELRFEFSHCTNISYYIGDVRDYSSINDATAGVDLIFHAAALKQVPSCEFHPNEALKTNVNGTENVLSAARANSVSRVILLSTDKAVYPINAMGITKALAEKLLVAKSRNVDSSKLVYAATRYGNVMASRGSVIPLFMDQILSGSDVTITDPGMTRFLMSLEDSVDLVLYALSNSEQGSIYVQKAPAATIYDLAEALYELCEAEKSIEIIGTRHGEKLYETLVSREEMAKASENEQYYVIPADNRDLNYKKFFSDGSQEHTKAEDFTSHNAPRLTVPQIKERLLSLEYVRNRLANA